LGIVQQPVALKLGTVLGIVQEPVGLKLGSVLGIVQEPLQLANVLWQGVLNKDHGS
jgi:hypothetical protein